MNLSLQNDSKDINSGDKYVSDQDYKIHGQKQKNPKEKDGFYLD